MEKEIIQKITRLLDTRVESYEAYEAIVDKVFELEKQLEEISE